MKTAIRYVLGLAALLLSSSSFSAEWYEVYDSGYYGRGGTPELACQQYLSNRRDNHTTQLFPYLGIQSTGDEYKPYECLSQLNNGSSYTPDIYIYSGSCPSQLPYQWEDGFCYSEMETPSCPDGQFMEGGQCTSACVQGAQVSLTMQFQDVQQNITDPRNGCKLEMSPGPLSCNSLMSACNITYTDTGVYDENFSWPDGVQPEPVPPVEPAPEPITTETVDGPITETVNNPDGSTTKTSTTEITKVNDQGQTVEIIGESIVLKNKEGEIIDILQQTTTNTFTDGSFSVTETTTTTATPNQVTEVKKNLTDGSTTVTNRTYKSGQSGTVVTTKTETFDSQGNSTGKTETTTGTLDEVGDGEGEGGDEDYSYDSPPGKDGLYEKTDKTFESVLSNFVSQAQQAPFMTAADSFFTVTTGGTCPTWSIPEFWVFPAYPITAQCSPMMNQFWPLISAVIMSLAAFQAFRWAFL